MIKKNQENVKDHNGYNYKNYHNTKLVTMTLFITMTVLIMKRIRINVMPKIMIKIKVKVMIMIVVIMIMIVAIVMRRGTRAIEITIRIHVMQPMKVQAMIITIHETKTGIQWNRIGNDITIIQNIKT